MGCVHCIHGNDTHRLLGERDPEEVSSVDRIGSTCKKVMVAASYLTSLGLIVLAGWGFKEIDYHPLDIWNFTIASFLGLSGLVGCCTCTICIFHHRNLSFLDF